VGSNTIKLACSGWVYVTCKFFPYWNDETEIWAASSTCKEEKENFLTWTMVKGPTSVPRGSYTRRPIQDGQCWAMDQVVVANHRTNKNWKKGSIVLKLPGLHWVKPFVYLHFFIYYFYSYRGDSLTLGFFASMRFREFYNIERNRQCAKTRKVLDWEGFGWIPPLRN
jgi:hypothetical protein